MMVNYVAYVKSGILEMHIGKFARVNGSSFIYFMISRNSVEFTFLIIVSHMMTLPS